MQELFIYFIISASTFLTSLIFVIIGIIRKKNILLVAGVLLMLVAVWTGGTAISKVVSEASEMMEPRSGDEIYRALFGEPVADCVDIVDHQDQVVPQVDDAIWLHIKTCPAEVERILSLRDFDHSTISTEGMHSSGPSANNNWFTPEEMGENIHQFTSFDPYGNGQEIYCNLDSTEIYVKDILN